MADAFLAVATVGMVTGMVWADSPVECLEKEVEAEGGTYTIPAYQCAAGQSCGWVKIYNENNEFIGVAGICISPPQQPA